MTELERRPEPVEGELLTDTGGLGVPARHAIRDLSRLRNVTPGAEAPAADDRCIHGFRGCSFEPAHVHGRSGVVSPACSSCARIWRGYGDEEFAAEYDERGRCRDCRARLEA